MDPQHPCKSPGVAEGTCQWALQAEVGEPLELTKQLSSQILNCRARERLFGKIQVEMQERHQH